QGFYSAPVLYVGRRVGSGCLVIVGNIQARPLPSCVIPPNQLLTLAPRLAIRTRRSAVVNDSAIIGPCESPSVPKQIVGRSFAGTIPLFLGEHSAVDPSTARRRSIVLQIPDMAELFPFWQRPAIDLSQHIFRLRIGIFAFRRVVPG